MGDVNLINELNRKLAKLDMNKRHIHVYVTDKIMMYASVYHHKHTRVDVINPIGAKNLHESHTLGFHPDILFLCFARETGNVKGIYYAGHKDKVKEVVKYACNMKPEILEAQFQLKAKLELHDIYRLFSESSISTKKSNKPAPEFKINKKAKRPLRRMLKK